MAWIRSPLLASASVLGIAVCFPLFKLGTASANFAAKSRSGFLLSLRYLPQKLVSIVSCVRFVSRLLPDDPVAELPGRVRNVGPASRSISAVEAPLETK